MVAVLAVFQLTACVYMMCSFPAIFIVPIYQCMFIISLIVGGSTYFQEFETMTPLSISMFAFGCIVCFTGIGVMCALDLDEENSSEEEAPHAGVASDTGNYGAGLRSKPALVAIETPELRPQECCVPTTTTFDEI
jgi:hypothetical protein